MGAKTKVEFENDRVRVTRVQQSGRGSTPPVSRHDRLVVYLREGHVHRTEGAHREELRRPSGEVVWRGRSEHHVEVLEDGEHEVLIVELKP